MPHQSQGASSAPPGADRFATTHWSLVLSAGRGGVPRAREALGKLIGTYWYPLYAFARRRGLACHDAQDLVQGFFARLVEKPDLGRVDPAKGRFRAFLLASMKHFMSNERDRARAFKRGGPRVPASIDGEGRYAREPADPATPESLFERAWALTLLEHALRRLREEARASGKEALFEALKPALQGAGTLPYAEIAGHAGMSEGAVKEAARRMRARYRELLRGEVAWTVEDPADVGDELRHLMASLSR